MKYALALAIAFALFYPRAAAAIAIDTVPIGNAGNAGELQPNQPTLGHAGGIFGRVTTDYRIATTEVTNAQYVAFLNAVAASDPNSLYDPLMNSYSRGGIVRSGVSGSYSYAVKADVSDGGPGNTNYTYGDKPVNFVSWFDAARFANWMQNGQPTGAQSSTTTENGAYTLNQANPVAVARNSGATWFLPTENQWYKAAYYDGSAGVYYDYPTRANIAPDNNIPLNDSGNSANYFVGGFTQQESYPLTTAGAYVASKSPYGTTDQGGNVWEWTEAFGINANNTQNTSLRIIRGGAFDSDSSTLNAANGQGMSSGLENEETGFRLATIATPVGVLGDYNNNGVVDAADYILYRKYLGQSVTLPNDYTPGTVTTGDYTVWQNHFGQTSSGSGSGSLLQNSVPEAGSLSLLGLGATLSLFYRGLRQKFADSRSPRLY
jgi:formylglycine-generating enzyme required for sulfatase activity